MTRLPCGKSSPQLLQFYVFYDIPNLDHYHPVQFVLLVSRYFGCIFHLLQLVFSNHFVLKTFSNDILILDKSFIIRGEVLSPDVQKKNVGQRYIDIRSFIYSNCHHREPKTTEDGIYSFTHKQDGQASHNFCLFQYFCSGLNGVPVAFLLN